jgi:hypothetical protein
MMSATVGFGALPFNRVFKKKKMKCVLTPVSRELCDDDSSECGPNPICDKGPEETAMDDHPIVLLGEELKKKTYMYIYIINLL